ncbi:transglutaminase-like domain-containing protein [Altererythrobacter lutimaris]|uniref:Transglutaminase family protein n=1 Tax=Altererythrobacter lutimaris TaxID=2743979 RepID=A0A850HBC3_9SPHN|nr:transglutaminase family protein [Altererythrobacter lutimaris]NVE94840.1 transglutaminase family protein [Altererythrobacter lutimaris]
MQLIIDAQLSVTLDQPTDALLQCEAAKTAAQRVIRSQTSISPNTSFSRVAAQDGVGERLWLKADGKIDFEYRAEITISRVPTDIAALASPEPQSIPAYAVPYFFNTRYCSAEKFQPFVDSEFKGTAGGQRIKAIEEWVAKNLTYAPGVSNSETTALDTFAQREGVCRDYAHVLISLVRASGIPARYVSCFAPEVSPQDYHAVAQVLLQDPKSGACAWHLVDPTRMSTPADTAIIGVGRDAGDVSFLTTFGPCQLERSVVSVTSDE